jgi:AcrR family transcriptional regulator
MDEVARAAQLSRQGLYLHFATKEELFRETVRSVIDGSFGAASEALGAPGVPFESRLVRAFDEWIGRFVGMMGSGAEDLVEAGDELADGIVTRHKELFVEALAKAIRSAGLVSAYKGTGVNGRQLAETLVATAHGLKAGAKTRPEFVERFTLAVKVFCAPLRSAPSAGHA